jgi:hypothetical protein
MNRAEILQLHGFKLDSFRAAATLAANHVKLSFPSLLRARIITLASTALFFVSAFSASANLLTTFPEMGDLLRWGAFSLQGGISDTTDLSGNTDIQGDVGIAGSGNLAMSGNATIHGNLYYRSNGTLSMSGNAKVTGSKIHNQDSVLDNGVTEANNTSTHAFSLVPNRPLTNVNLSGNQSMTVTGAPGETVVLKLQNFNLSGNGLFTLQGTATTNFVINVTNQFSITGNGTARIALSGGLTWDNILFNVVGTGGGDVILSGNGKLTGVLMANKRTVDISGNALVTGEVVANKIKISGNGKIVHPPVSSP